MDRGRSTLTRRDRALADVASVLAGLDHPGAIIGGIAVIAWGFARFTGDIDCAIEATPADVRQVLAAFERNGFQARAPDAVAFAEQNLVLLLRHRATEVEVDVSLAQLDFERIALARAVKRPFGKVKIPVPSVTDLFIYKLAAGRPKDLQDVVELMALGLEYDASQIEEHLRRFDELLDTDCLGAWRRIVSAQ